MKRFLPVFIMSFVAQTGAAEAQVRMDLINEYPTNSIHAEVANFFIEELGKEFDVTAHHGGALGYKSVDHYDAVGDGAVQIASSFSGAWSGINPIFLVSSLPFIATSIEETRLLYDVTRPYYKAALEADNQVFLLATPWPPSGFWASRAVDIPEALEGLTIRTYDSPGTTTMANAGASPLQLSWADVVPQLTTGGINGVLTSADNGAASQLWEYLSDFTEVNYALPLQVMHMNRDAFEMLDDKAREALLAAAEAAEDFGWGQLETRVMENYEELKANNVTVTTEVSEDLAKLLQESSDPVVTEWVERVGADAESLLDDYNASIAK